MSALLIAGAFSEAGLNLIVTDPGELPWITVTLQWLSRLGISVEQQGFTNYQVVGGARISGFEYTVPGDFSSAAFPIAAALVTQSEVVLSNLDMSDSQGDKKLIAVLQQMGAEIDIDDKTKTLRVRGGNRLVGAKVDINDFIDAIPVLSVLGCYAEGETCIYNGAVARQKECDRITCIASELRKMGADIDETEDGLLIRQSQLRGAEVNSHHDHRLAMSLTVAALGALGDSKICATDCVSKTFPNFVNQLNGLGTHIEVF